MKIQINRNLWLCFLGVLFCSYTRLALTPTAADVTIANVASASAAAMNPPPPVVNDDPFVAPPELQAAVSFWENVFALWDRDQVVLHDSEHLGVVYELIDLPGTDRGRLSAGQQREIKRRVGRLEYTLNNLEYRVKRRMSLTEEQRLLLHAIEHGAERGALRGAGERVRVQRGMRTSFLRGLKASGQHEKSFRQVFKDAGLPQDLAYLPHVESAFTARARSSAGAIGVWQFLPETGCRFLRINKAVDERYDPVLATRGAARYLAYAYSKLGDWGLAITAYNHGLSGMLRAKQLYGADLERIIRG